MNLGSANTVAAPAQPPPSAPSKEADAGPPQSNQVVEVQGASEAVEVQGDKVRAPIASDAVVRDEPLGKAKPAAPSPAPFGAAAQVRSNEIALVGAVSRAGAKRELTESYHANLTRWTISSDGQLQHSIDSGKSWLAVSVADKATFRALSFNGPDVWVGGAAGLLYHSSDSGARWMQVQPVADGAILTADIAAIEFTDPQHGKVTTAKGEVWLTENAGQTWRIKR